MRRLITTLVPLYIVCLLALAHCIAVTHGAGGNENSDAEGFSSLVRSAIEENEIGPVIVVFPNGGRSGYISEACPKLRYEKFFTEELLPHIDAKYRTINSRKARAIGGFSMGGGGALGLALKHPELFYSAATWAAALLDSCPDEKSRYAPAPNDLFTKLIKKDSNRANRRCPPPADSGGPGSHSNLAKSFQRSIVGAKVTARVQSANRGRA